MRDTYDGVLRSVNNQNRAVYLANLPQIVESIEGQDWDSRHYTKRAHERTLQNQPCNRTAKCEINRGAGTDRTSEGDDPVRLDTHSLRQIVVRCVLIIVSVCLGRLALACPVSLVVIGQDREAGT